VADLASTWDDPGSADDASGTLLLETLRLASQLASAPGREREASLLLLHSDVLTCVAASGVAGNAGHGPYRVTEHPAFDHAMTTGEMVEDASQIVFPVRAAGDVTALLVIDGGEGLDDGQRSSLMLIARILGLGVDQAASIDELQQEAERSRRLERLKGEFLNIAAHELRSPLGIIRGYASMLTEGMLAEPDRGVALTRIGEKTEEMARQVSEMLETARLETLGFELELEPVDLLGVIDDAAEAMRPLIGSNHRFVVSAPRDTIAVVADRRRLTMTLTNLIDNAIKYSPAGGEIEIGCGHDGRDASISVRDHGIGISAEQAHLLFTRFGRLVTPETSHIRGTGLGLYLARETARLHGGDIVVTSTPGGGSTFTVILPLA
jgi:signal transduction histidine kinase